MGSLMVDEEKGFWSKLSGNRLKISASILSLYHFFTPFTLIPAISVRLKNLLTCIHCLCVYKNMPEYPSALLGG